MIRFGLSAVAAVVCLCSSNGQSFSSRVAGRSLEFEHFRPQVLGAHPQNWAIVQDSDGLIYVGNNAGVLVFDGNDWKLVKTSNNSIVRSLGIGADGTVYVGAKDEIGFLRASTRGELEYESLVGRLDDRDRGFADVWNTLVIGEAVYFVTPSRILIWRDGEVVVVNTDTKFHTAFRLDGKLIVREVGVGLVDISAEGGKTVIPDGGRFADVRVYAFLDTGVDNSWLIATRSNGLFRYDGLMARSLPSDADSILATAGVYHGVALPSGQIALATLGAGVIVLNSDGSLARSIGIEYGLPDLVVNHVYVDRDNGLWVVLNSGGLVRIDTSSPVSVFDRRDGLEGVVYGIAAMDASLFVVTGSGLYRSRRLSNRPSNPVLEFEEIPNVELPFGITQAGEALVVMTQAGLEIYEGNEVQRIALSKSHAVFAVTSDSLLVGHADGLTLLRRRRGSQWERDSLDLQIGDVRDIVGTLTKNEVLVVTRDASMYLVDVWPQSRVREVPYASPKVSGEGADLARAYGDVVIVSPNAYRLTTVESDVGLEMVLDSTLTSNDRSNPLVTVGEDGEGRPWLVRKNNVCVLMGRSQRCVNFQSLSFPRETIGNIYFDGDIAWISSGNTLYRFDPALDREVVPTFAPLVRRVSLIGSDSTLFLGHSSNATPEPRLAYADNDVQFRFSAPIYYGQDQIRYQYLLDGRDSDRGNDWSPWTASTVAEYTNLREGKYSFRVRAKNIYGFDSPEGGFSFQILPPWYRTWWAYLLYVSGCAIVAGLSVRYYRMTVAHRRAEEQAKELAAERLVNERLQHANERLKIANNRLVEVNALKDEFLATTSHELRTPITAIQGYASILREELGGPHREFAEIIDKSSQRLMRTLNSVLDLAKLRSGTIEMHPAVLDLQDFVNRTVESCFEMAASKHLELVVDDGGVPVFVECDQYLLRNAILNVLDNAIKFSDSGSISISVRATADQGCVIVADQGVGIDGDFLPHIFDDFKQESDGLAREHGGTGLGLAITSLMVNAMNGEITVESQKGVGTTATIRVPVARNYDSADEWTPTKTSQSPSQTRIPAVDRQPEERPSADPKAPEKVS